MEPAGGGQPQRLQFGARATACAFESCVLPAAAMTLTVPFFAPNRSSSKMDRTSILGNTTDYMEQLEMLRLPDP